MIVTPVGNATERPAMQALWHMVNAIGPASAFGSCDKAKRARAVKATGFAEGMPPIRGELPSETADIDDIIYPFLY
jgi:hypothetical protein